MVTYYFANGSLQQLVVSRQRMYLILPDYRVLKGWYHTGQWPHDDVDFNGLRVGQIGTGSTGIQAVPEIAKTCEHLTVFQRTPNYSIPARNTKWDATYTNWVRSHYNELKALVRSTSMATRFVFLII